MHFWNIPLTLPYHNFFFLKGKKSYPKYHKDRQKGPLTWYLDMHFWKTPLTFPYHNFFFLKAKSHTQNIIRTGERTLNMIFGHAFYENDHWLPLTTRAKKKFILKEPIYIHTYIHTYIHIADKTWRCFFCFLFPSKVTSFSFSFPFVIFVVWERAKELIKKSLYAKRES